ERLPREMPVSESATIVIFGASGDLTARKLMPALYDLWCDGYLSDSSPIVGVARRDKTDDAFRDEMYEAVREGVREGNVPRDRWNQFARRLHYRRLDLSTPDGYRELAQCLDTLE